MSPKDENELQHMINTAVTHKGPIVIRYPRGKGLGIKIDKELKKIEIGKAEILTSGEDVGILAIGTMVQPALEAAEMLLKDNISATVVNARFANPLDTKLILSLAKKVKCLVTVEENVVAGGFGSAVAELVGEQGVRVKILGFPDQFIEHGSMQILRDKYGLTGKGIYQQTKEFLK
ncbi:MAG: transketolase C-terminal domain-containing protein, partial [bacterium]|nr:transketolase C-terminal domain-containing protein [bacterium]